MLELDTVPSTLSDMKSKVPNGNATLDVRNALFSDSHRFHIYGYILSSFSSYSIPTSRPSSFKSEPMARPFSLTGNMSSAHS